MKKDENGWIVVETIGTLIPFVLICISIITMINITAVQQRVHYAITQTALELSMYSYVVHALGLSEPIMNWNETAANTQGQIDSVINDVNSIRLFDDLETVTGAIGSLMQTGGDALNDPMETISNLLSYGLNRAYSHVVQEVVIRPMVNRHLERRSGDFSADDYLRTFNVADRNGTLLDLSNSVILNSNGDVIIVAEYSIDFTFGIIPVPPLTFRQTAKTRAWIGGYTP